MLGAVPGTVPMTGEEEWLACRDSAELIYRSAGRYGRGRSGSLVAPSPPPPPRLIKKLLFPQPPFLPAAKVEQPSRAPRFSPPGPPGAKTRRDFLSQQLSPP